MRALGTLQYYVFGQNASVYPVIEANTMPQPQEVHSTNWYDNAWRTEWVSFTLTIKQVLTPLLPDHALLSQT